MSHMSCSLLFSRPLYLLQRKGPAKLSGSCQRSSPSYQCLSHCDHRVLPQMGGLLTRQMLSFVMAMVKPWGLGVMVFLKPLAAFRDMTALAHWV